MPSLSIRMREYTNVPIYLGMRYGIDNSEDQPSQGRVMGKEGTITSQLNPGLILKGTCQRETMPKIPKKKL